MFLLVGDVHAKKSNLEETRRLLTWIEELASKTAQEQGEDITILFLGDQFNDFGVARVEVIDLWSEFANKSKNQLIFLVGNHDYNSDCSATAMSSVSSEKALIINSPQELPPIYWLDEGVKTVALPFMKNNEEFIDSVNQLTDNNQPFVVFCHQEFNGAQFENGFYAPHGVDHNLIKNKNISIISGHIHKHQSFANIWYPGTPRHLTRSDAGETKGVWLLGPKVQDRTFIPTPHYAAKPFVSLQVREGQEIPSFPLDCKLYVDVYGSASFAKSILPTIPDHANIRTFIQGNEPKKDIKESEGIPKAFSSWVKFYVKDKKIPEQIATKATEKVLAICPILKGVQGE